MAEGNPLPQVTWMLDGFQFDHLKDIRIGDYVTNDNYVVSFVNITSVNVEHGGEYTCTASNDVTNVQHSAAVKVIGDPFVRRMNNMTVVEHKTLKIKCPVGGHPIEEISWTKSK